MLGISQHMISLYESGQRIPSIQTTNKMVSVLNFNLEDITTGRNYSRSCNDCLTDEERQFAEIYHGCVYKYLNTQNLSEDDWYDVVICGYLRAVKTWFGRNDLHKYSFSTIAYSYMRSAVCSEREKQKRRPEYRAVSFDDIIPGTDGLTYEQILCDPRDCVGI